MKIAQCRHCEHWENAEKLQRGFTPKFPMHPLVNLCPACALTLLGCGKEGTYTFYYLPREEKFEIKIEKELKSVRDALLYGNFLTDFGATDIQIYEPTGRRLVLKETSYADIRI